MEKVKVPALRFEQNGKTLFLTNISFGQLNKIARIDVWNPDIPVEKKLDVDKQGYQRQPIRAHFRKVAKYVKRSDAILPTSILLSARQPMKFVAEDEDGSGLLTIEAPLWIVDGQHRLKGLENAIEEYQQDQLRDFVLPVVIMENVPKLQEIVQFRTVNVTQKKVRTDLADRLLSLMAQNDPSIMSDLVSRRKQWKLRAIKICEVINARADGPWYHRIRKPNAPKTDFTIATEGSFTTSLRPVLRSDVIDGHTDEQIMDFIIDYWSGIQELMPETFESPRDYVIQKTPGMYVLHMVLPSVFLKCRDRRKFSRTAIKEILSKDDTHFLDPGFWKSGGEGASIYTGMGAFAELADETKRELQ